MTQHGFFRFAAALLLGAGAGFAHGAYLGFAPAAQTVALGDPAAVDVVIAGLGGGTAPSLGAFDFVVTYDPAVLTLGDVTFGGLLGDAGAFESLNGVVAGTGSVNVFEVSLLLDFELDALQSDAFTLVTLAFGTSAVGTSALSLGNLVLGDGLGAPLALDGIGTGAVTVTAPSVPVPEPPVWVLIGLGVAWLLIRRMRRPIPG